MIELERNGFYFDDEKENLEKFESTEEFLKLSDSTKRMIAEIIRDSEYLYKYKILFKVIEPSDFSKDFTSVKLIFDKEFLQMPRPLKSNMTLSLIEAKESLDFSCSLLGFVIHSINRNFPEHLTSALTELGRKMQRESRF